MAYKYAKVTKPNERIIKSIEALQVVVEEDVDGFVRRNAEVNLNLIREWLKKWTDKSPRLEIKIRKEVLEIEARGVRKMKEEEEEKEGKIKDESKENEVIIENEKKYEGIQKAARKERLEY